MQCPIYQQGRTGTARGSTTATAPTGDMFVSGMELCAGLTIAEYFRDVEGQDVLLFVDNIFRFTQVRKTRCHASGQTCRRGAAF